MTSLRASLQAWNTPAFTETLAREVAGLGIEHLPLQAGLSQGSVALDDDLGIMVVTVTEGHDHISARLGISYSGVVAGCACADDPAPENRTTEYCEVLLKIDKATAHTSIALLQEQAD